MDRIIVGHPKEILNNEKIKKFRETLVQKVKSESYQTV